MIRIANSGYGVNFNQLADVRNSSQTASGVSFTYDSTSHLYHFTGTTTGSSWLYPIKSISFVKGHKFLVWFSDISALPSGIYYYATSTGVLRQPSIITVSTASTDTLYFVVTQERTVDYETAIMVFDLTQMFGAGNEPTTVAEFREMYPDNYYDYTLSQWQWAKKGKITSYPTPCFGVDFNQKFNSASPNISTRSGVSCTRNNNVFTFSGTATAEAIFSLVYAPPIGHKILYSPTIIRTKNLPNWAISQNYLGNIGEPLIRVANRSNCVLYAHFVAGHITDGLSFLLNIFDLTQMYGEGNEPATVEEFRSKFPDTYYPYTVSEMRYIDEKTSYALLPIEYHVVGIMNKVELLNLWNDNYLSKHNLSEGVQMWATTVISSSNINNVFKPSTTYRFECDVEVLSLPEDKVLYDSTCGFLIYKQGGDNRFLMRVDVRYFTGHYSGTFTTPSNIEGYSLLGYTGRWWWTNSAYFGTVKFTNIKLIEGSLLYHGIPTYNYLQRLLPAGTE